MTLDDLLKVFEQGFQAKLQSEDYPREAFATPTLNRAGIRAVVEALRDELFPDLYIAPQWEVGDAMAVLDKILGSDVGVKVDTHGSPELNEDARKLAAMGQDPGMTLNELLALATDPAPVCEWRYVAAGNVWLTECEERINGWTTKIGKTECQFCDGAIKFTETEE